MPQPFRGYLCSPIISAPAPHPSGNGCRNRPLHPIRYCSLPASARTLGSTAPPNIPPIQQEWQDQNGIHQSAPAERMLTAAVLFTLVVTKSVSINATLLAYFHCKINILRVAQRDFIISGILQCDLITAKGVKRHNRDHIPRTGGNEDIVSLFTGGLPLDSPPEIATVRTKNGFTSVGICSQ